MMMRGGAALLLLGCAQVSADEVPCVMWRQTGGCRSDGPREPHYDETCNTTISRWWSGYCECHENLHIGFSCGQADTGFTCDDQCANPPPPTPAPTPIPPIAECEPYPENMTAPLPPMGPGTAGHAIENPEEYVNTRWGTKGGGGNDHGYDRGHGLSSGNLYPQVVRPWGFNAWSVVTDNLGQWWFNPWDWQFNGIRCTHQPSPWLGDWGHFLFYPMMVQSGRFASYYQSSYNPDKSEWRPYLFSTSLVTYATSTGQTTVDVTSSTHAAAMRVTYPVKKEQEDSGYAYYDETRKLVFKFPAQGPGEQPAEWDTTGKYATLEGWTVSEAEKKLYKLYYSAEIVTNATLKSTRVQSGSNEVLTYALYENDGHEFLVRVATSLVSVCQARHNRISQVGHRTFDEVLAESKAEWRGVLGTVDVEDAGNQEDDKLEILYTSLFRASLYPRFLSEVNRDGEELHMSTYVDGEMVRPGPAVADSGSWDSHHTVYPLLSLVQTPVVGRMIQGWANAYNESGMVPQWSSPGHRNIMVGTMSDAYFADAIVNEIGGFDVALAYEGMRNNAFGDVRAGMSDYVRYGYLRYGTQAVSVSLNHMMADWSIAQAAKKLGKMDDYSILMDRSRNYTRLFNNETGFLQRRGWNGDFVGKSNFDEYAWGGDYTEGGPWQYRFYAPHDPKGLAQVYRNAGLDMCGKIEEAMRGSPAIHLGIYSKVVHEMSEMVNNCWGQYAHNNQPSHHILYMLIAMSDEVSDRCSQLGQAYLRRTVTETYHANDDMFPGDEDNGEMAAWFVLSSLGLYQLAPGSGEYTLGIPLFKDVVVSLGNGNKLRITTDEKTFKSDDHPKKGKHHCKRGDKHHKKHHKHDKHKPAAYDPTAFAVKEVVFNGKRVAGTTVRYAALMKGGHLHFKLQDAPSVKGA